eukprot:CAMPEP_0178389530 /NCGR_PEP_ID=MMETSP0689_2-20121128/10168_1 /TAXON_ID=160604 /ORGANISM="Amphidinium massartii, Strain CS-259" /LENGTH=174 /DNA_ID=CAMNT_0020009991 /DNA_START=142 /DNA_END=666 /DNA_ORIENTATION=+
MSKSVGALSHTGFVEPPVRRNNLVGRKKATGQVVGEIGAQASMILKNLEEGVKDIEDQIAKDEKSLKDMDRNLAIAKAEADRLARVIQQEETFVEAMSPDKDLGAAVKQLDQFVLNVKQDYREAREKHKGAYELLKNEFGYNPAYKKGRGGQEFSGKYHTMAKDPSKIPPPSNR